MSTISEDDDFHVVSQPTDARAYFLAFQKALELVRSVKPKISEDPGRISTLASHLLATGDSNQTLFRAALDRSESASAIWLSEVRSKAEWLTSSGLVREFRGISGEHLRDVARWSNSQDLRDISANVAALGIALVYVRALPATKIDGAAFAISNGTPVIGLSLRHARLDNFWFTLMHELAHISLHYDMLASPIVDDFDSGFHTDAEREADRLAQNALIPASAWRTCPANASRSVEDVLRFAEEVGIAPAIVAGRVRRELGRYDLFSDLVQQVNTREVLFGKN